MLDTTRTDSSQTDAPIADLGPLAWVFDELRKSLDAANKAIKRFVRESEKSRNNDLEAVDPSSLRVARQQLHQAVGALEMVGLAAPAQVLRSMEAAVQRFVRRPLVCDEDAANRVERASFALIEYLEAVLNNKPVHPVALFVQYREVQELAAAERIHPADLWSFDQRGIEVAAPAGIQPLNCDAPMRSLFDRLVLLVVKTNSPAGAQQLAKFSAGLSAGAADARRKTFWRVTAAYFEAVAHQLLPDDVYVKRAASRILLQFASFAQGQNQVSETLLHDLLFFCSQARGGTLENTPHLMAVRKAYGLEAAEPVDYQLASLGRYDPAILAQARKRINAAKETWSLYSGGDASRARQVVDQFGLIGDSLLKLHPASTVLAQALLKAADQAAHDPAGVRPELAMEVATTTLYLEAAFEDFDPSDAEMTERTQALAARLELVRAGAAAQPLDPWMEQLYRRVSDRQTMGSVVGELKVSLGEAEKSLDQFFRAPNEKGCLHVAVSQLAQMRGVLSVLGLDQAVQTVVRMRAMVDQMLDTDVDKDQAREAGTFQQLGNNLSALSFLVDMLNYQPLLAKKLFVFDQDKGELLPLMGRNLVPEAIQASAPQDGEGIFASMPDAAEGLPESFGLSDRSQSLDHEASQPDVDFVVSGSDQTVVPDDAVETASVPTDLSQAESPVSVTAANAQASEDNEEDELLDIFLEEAREVVGNGLEALRLLKMQPANLEELTTLRRAFHTLKGSSRMVGLTEFGEAAWAMEQLVNAALAEQRAVHSHMLSLSGDAMVALSRWVEDIASHTDGGWHAQPFRTSAEAWRNHAQYLPLDLQTSAQEGQAERPVVGSSPTVSAAVVVLAPAQPLPEADALGDSVPLPENLEDGSAKNPAKDDAVSEQGAVELQRLTEAEPPLLHMREEPTEQAPIQVGVEAAELSETPVEFADMPLFGDVGHERADLFVVEAADSVHGQQAFEEINFGSLEALSSSQPATGHEEAVFEAAEGERPTALVDEPVSALSLVWDGLSLDLDEDRSLVSDTQSDPERTSDSIDFDLDDDALRLNTLSEMVLDGGTRVGTDEPGQDVDGLMSELSAPVVSSSPDDTEHLEPPVSPTDEVFAPHVLLETGAAVEAFSEIQETEETEETEALGAVELAGSFQDEVPDEQTRVIGSLHIGIKLYNVYLNEADEWSRRLDTEMAEWALERHMPVPAHAEALAHSLAGSSATVGFQSLSDIARALEHALESVSLRQQAGWAATPEQAELFVLVSEDIRRLLHQFAAGFLNEPKPELLEALYRVVHEPVPDELPQETFELADDSVAQDADIEASMPWDAAPTVATQAPEVLAETIPLDVPAVLPTVETAGLSELLPRMTGLVQDIDDDIDVLDTIDADLFPIFADEAHELLPQLGAALRQWVARPDNGSARSEVLRHLHTLKGSARLSGALRLGEMVHRMETTAERLGSDVQRSADLEPLEASFDAISARFELLNRTDLGALNVIQQAPEQVPADAMSPPLLEQVNVSTLATMASNAPTLVSGKGLTGLSLSRLPTPIQARAGAAVRVRSELLDRLVNQIGEVMTTRSRMESELVTLRGSLKDLTGNLDRLRQQLRDIELQAETQMQSRLAQARDVEHSFDPLEFDRFTRVQELTRMMAESVNDVATVQRNLQRAVESTEDGLVAQARQTRELQRDLLRTRMVEFEGISERLYRVVRQASKETGKQVRLDITGGQIEMDRGVLDRVTAAFEHLLRNSVVHGIEAPEVRLAAGKAAEGHITIALVQELNDVSVVFRDDGAGLNLPLLREKAIAQGYVLPGTHISDEAAAQLVFAAGLSTVREVSELAGRGIGMDVVRNDVLALGGRIETSTQPGQSTTFKLVLPLTTAVTQVVMLRAGALTLGVPSNLVELVRRVTSDELAQAYAKGFLMVGTEEVPFYWGGALLLSSAQSTQAQGRTLPVVIFRSAAQRVAMHVDEVLGNQEVVVKNLGPQLSRLPGLAGMSVLASGAVALIYNPVALATVYGTQVREWLGRQQRQAPQVSGDAQTPMDMVPNAVPLVLVVDDSITVRRVTQRLLQREGYRVSLAADGLQALERLQQERPNVVLSDIEMPRMDGFDLVRNIRSDPRLTDLPVIMITSRIADKHREHARELGVDHYLGKPYPEDELLALIAHYTKIAAEV
ncbi:MAG: Hpt domain-containing protein [Hydrogenophaga sp.]|uniref:hybrid sensor histidine kinase/response regulator n=1 Tax=Hydrogenophaga sp. TaxID=1904254 RepID=UPI0027370DA8|nr:Hpt domain-containing protein [Hydrogenophaga sp.]MDP3345922.1 Hpt domain-containing protein [Hydrogenophaga sp.]